MCNDICAKNEQMKKKRKWHAKQPTKKCTQRKTNRKNTHARANCITYKKPKNKRLIPPNNPHILHFFGPTFVVFLSIYALLSTLIIVDEWQRERETHRSFNCLSNWQCIICFLAQSTSPNLIPTYWRTIGDQSELQVLCICVQNYRAIHTIWMQLGIAFCI